MTNFNYQIYEDRIKGLLCATDYAGTLHPEDVIIASYRTYTELLVRFILGLNSEKRVNLGKRDIQKSLKKCDIPSELLLKAINNINTKGNDSIHTEKSIPATLDDLESVKASIRDIYAFMFISFFTRGPSYRFGLNDEIICAFSILPPIIRYTVLKELITLDPDNVVIIDKFLLSILKAFGANEAYDWLEQHKKKLMITPSVPEETTKALKDLQAACPDSYIELPSDMYTLCSERVKKVEQTIENHGLLYSSFEEAKVLYNEYGYIDSSSQIANEFNSIMEFIYLGRRTENNDVSERQLKYTTIQFE